MEWKLVIPLENFVVEGTSTEHKIIATYCLIDEMLKGLNVKNDVSAKITNAEILTMAYLAVSDFNGNYRKAHLYFLSNTLQLNNILL